MLFDGKAIRLNKGDSFTFYEHEVNIKEPGNYVSKIELRHFNVIVRYKQEDCVEMCWLEIKFTLTMAFWHSQ